MRPSDIERYRERRRQDGAAEATVNRELTCLRAVYRTAITDGKVEKSPVLSRFFYKERNQRVRQLADEEEGALRAALPARHVPKLDVALYTGFRRDNVFRLRWEDVNFNSGLVWARGTKSGEDYAVPMNDALRAVLHDLPSRLRNAWVFPDRTSEKAMDESAVKIRSVSDVTWMLPPHADWKSPVDALPGAMTQTSIPNLSDCES